jgi:DivIVA domain-containing protein
MPRARAGLSVGRGTIAPVTLLLLLVVLAVVGGVAALFAGRITGGMPGPSSTVPARALPAGPITGADVAGLRFVPALRGYRMDQVDAALDRLAGELDRLRALVPAEHAGHPEHAGPVPGESPGRFPGEELS